MSYYFEIIQWINFIWKLGLYIYNITLNFEFQFVSTNGSAEIIWKQRKFAEMEDVVDCHF